MNEFILSIKSSVVFISTPFSKAIELDFWIVFPSAIGSLNGIPISIADAKFSSIRDLTISSLSSIDGYPEVIKGIIEQLTLEGIEGEISAINGIEVTESILTTKNNFVIRDTKTF